MCWPRSFARCIAFIVVFEEIHVTGFTYLPIVRHISNTTTTLITFRAPTEFLVGEISVSLDTYRNHTFSCNLGYRKISPLKKRATFRRGKDLQVQFPSLSCSGLYVVQIIPSSSFIDEQGNFHRPCYNYADAFTSNSNCPEVFQKLLIREKHQWNCNLNDWKSQCDQFRAANPKPKTMRHRNIKARNRPPTPKRQVNPSILPLPSQSSKSILKSPRLSMPGPRNLNQMGIDVTVIACIGAVTLLIIVVVIAVVFYLKHAKQAQHFMNENILRERRNFVTQTRPTFRVSKEDIDTDSVVV